MESPLPLVVRHITTPPPPRPLTERIMVRNIKVVTNHLDDLWTLYRDAFTELDTLAVQRHLMHRHEFDQVMRDPRVHKLVAVDNAGVVWGLGTFTNDLDAVPLISPQYFARHYPDDYAARRIWYVGFVAVKQRGSAPNPLPFSAIIRDMFDRAKGGRVVLDVCARTDNAKHLPRVVGTILHRSVGDVPYRVEDTQLYYHYDLTGVGV